MSAMGDRLLLLEDTAEALDAIDPELANQFRLVNGLPDGYFEALSRADHAQPSDAEPSATHVASVDDGPHGIRVSCSCGRWQADVGWDEIDDLVEAARAHFTTVGASILDQGATSPTAAPGADASQRWVS
jgi:hypothetical protein